MNRPEVVIKQEPDEVINIDIAPVTQTDNSALVKDEPPEDVKPFQKELPDIKPLISGDSVVTPEVPDQNVSKIIESITIYDDDENVPLVEVDGAGESVAVGDDDSSSGNGNESDEDMLTDERDIQVYEDILKRIDANVIINEPIASRVIVDERAEKVSYNLEDETNCQMVVLNNEPINSAWSAFRFPRNFADFLEIIFTWADNYLNRQSWPQEEIVARLKTYSHSLKYSSFRAYAKANLSYLLVLYYDRLKKDTNRIHKSNEDEYVSGKIDKIVKDDQWYEVTIELSKDLQYQLNFGYCCQMNVANSSTSVFLDRSYFGTILGKETVKRDGINISFLTVRTSEFPLIVGDKLTIYSLFRINHIYNAALSLFGLESSKYFQHYVSPTLTSSSSGVNLQFDESRKLSDLECDAIQKGVDTCALKIAESSPVCCLDFRETDESFKDIADVAFQIIESLRQLPAESGSIGKDIPALIICNNEEILTILHEKFKKANFVIYRLHRKDGPLNLREKIPRIGKIIAKSLAQIKHLKDAGEYEELTEKWDFLDEGIFSNEEQEYKFRELLEVAKVFAIQHSTILLGNIYDVANDTILNSAYADFTNCVILGASSIPEVFTLPLMKYGCEKFILLDRECTPWPSNKSLFARLTTIYEENHSLAKGANCSIVTSIKKKQRLPEPPKVSRHKLIEKNTKESITPSTSTGYQPDKRTNTRARVPYCPTSTRHKPTPATSSSNAPSESSDSTKSTQGSH